MSISQILTLNQDKRTEKQLSCLLDYLEVSDFYEVLKDVQPKLIEQIINRA